LFRDEQRGIEGCPEPLLAPRSDECHIDPDIGGQRDTLALRSVGRLRWGLALDARRSRRQTRNNVFRNYT
jgi:hypothetical protein